jgi:hypothetical protein
MRLVEHPETRAAVRSWYLTAVTLGATAKLLLATGWRTPYLRPAAVPATAAAVGTWSEGRWRTTRGPASGKTVIWLTVLVLATGLVALYGIATS